MRMVDLIEKKRDGLALTDEEMARIAAMDAQKRYYTATPETLAGYAAMVPPVDEQK